MAMAISKTAQNALVAVVCLFLAILILRVLLRYWARSLIKGYLANRANPQMSAFELRLRDLVFRDPALFMNRLRAPDWQGFVASLWKESGWAASKTKLHIDPPDAVFSIHHLHLADGRAIAVVQMPKSERSHDPILLGIVLPDDDSLASDIARARRKVHFFVLYGPGYGRESDLCEWTIRGKQLTFNIGAPRDPDGFAHAVGDKLAELGR
jgi:hypothetical protein